MQEGVSPGRVPGLSVTHFPNGLLEIQKTNRETGLLKMSAAGAPPVSGRLSWSIFPWGQGLETKPWSKILINFPGALRIGTHIIKLKVPLPMRLKAVACDSFVLLGLLMAVWGRECAANTKAGQHRWALMSVFTVVQDKWMDLSTRDNASGRHLWWGVDIQPSPGLPRIDVTVSSVPTPHHHVYGSSLPWEHSWFLQHRM